MDLHQIDDKEDDGYSRHPIDCGYNRRLGVEYGEVRECCGADGMLAKLNSPISMACHLTRGLPTIDSQLHSSSSLAGAPLPSTVS